MFFLFGDLIYFILSILRVMQDSRPADEQDGGRPQISITQGRRQTRRVRSYVCSSVTFTVIQCIIEVTFLIYCKQLLVDRFDI